MTSISPRPGWAAQPSGDAPISVAALGSTPAANRSRTISVFPQEVADKRGCSLARQLLYAGRVAQIDSLEPLIAQVRGRGRQGRG